MSLRRRDYAYPFRIDSASGIGAEAGYEAHVDQMIRQVLLTAPRERVDLPEFGCGLRNLVFAPNNEALAMTTQLLVSESLNRWLGNQIQVRAVTVVPPTTADEEAQLMIRIDYVLLETGDNANAEVKVL